MKKSKKKKNQKKSETNLKEKIVLTLDDVDMLDEVEEELEELGDDIYHNESGSISHPINFNNHENRILKNCSRFTWYTYSLLYAFG